MNALAVRLLIHAFLSENKVTSVSNETTQIILHTHATNQIRLEIRKSSVGVEDVRIRKRANVEAFFV